MTEKIFEEASYVLASTYRIAVMNKLAESPKTPSHMADDEGDGPSIAHVSRAIQDLRDEGLVKLLVPEDRQKGRIYGLTDRGEDVLETMDNINQ